MDSPGKDEQPGVLTVTGMLPSLMEEHPPALQSAAEESFTTLRHTIIQDLCRRIRYLLTLKARPPFRRELKLFGGN